MPEMSRDAVRLNGLSYGQWKIENESSILARADERGLNEGFYRRNIVHSVWNLLKLRDYNNVDVVDAAIDRYLRIRDRHQ